MEITRLFPACKNYIWGGEKLPERYGKQVDFRPVAESWELSCHKDGETLVEDGTPLRAHLTPAVLGTAACAFTDFPVLIKLIDACADLSVQVHPDDAYALANEDSFGKTEAWYIVEADEGAGIYLGFSRDVTKEELERAIAEERLQQLLNFFPVRAGECYFIPAGTIHAIGAGCLICEIQQNSNITYRAYDWGRRDKDGNTRPLHVEKALAVTNRKKYEKQAPVCQNGSDEVLASCKYFHSTRVLVNGEREISTDARSFKCLVCVAGEGSVGNLTAKRGDSFFVPASYGPLPLTGNMEIVCTEIL